MIESPVDPCRKPGRGEATEGLEGMTGDKIRCVSQRAAAAVSGARKGSSRNTGIVADDKPGAASQTAAHRFANDVSERGAQGWARFIRYR